MRHFFLLSLFCFFHTLPHAHEANKAFFNFKEKGNHIEVEAELPWTMRNALIAFRPSLEDSATTEDFEKTFAKYIQENLILKNEQGEHLVFVGYEKIERSGHAHQENYLITFRGSNLAEVRNTVMFNVYDDQVNHNTITTDSETKSFETTKASNTFFVDPNQDEWSVWLIVLIAAPVIYLLYTFWTRPTSQPKG